MAQQEQLQLFPPHLHTVAGALYEIFQEGGYADKVIERTLKADKRRGARDRAFIAENVYEIVRWYRLLYTLRGKEPQTVADWWEMIGIRYLIDGEKLPHWQEFRRLKPEKIQKKYQLLKQDRKVLESIPDWLDERGEAELGDQWPATLHALNQRARVVLRVNTLKTDQATLQAQLAERGIRTEPLGGDALLVTQRKSLFRTPAFKDGWFEIQDFSSQQVAPFCEVGPGLRVIDACAGAGGKTLHLAALMENKGQLIAMDTEDWKLKELKKRARRNGVHIFEPRLIDNSKVIKRLHESADRVLLDAPCSGLGVLRRNPDTKWKLSPEFIDQIRGVQQDILQRYSRMVKPEGLLIYVTCSILPSENQEQVAAFLASEAGKGFQLVEEKTILPQDAGYDGFFMAKLRRTA
ncbi:MAG: class I SAM-dependent methyltransferase [Lewinella sp.]|nr:class I SAM-dependent methyltransferase [Lewinella sp.]